MNSKFLDKLGADAEQYGVAVERIGRTRRVTGYRLVNAGTREPLSWAHATSDAPGWIGFTANPEVTGRKVGTREQVAAWCMDWACNGF